MIRLEVIATNGEEAELNVQTIISIDGKPFGGSQPSDVGLERRVAVLERLVLTHLAGVEPLLHQSQKASCSAESPPQSSPVQPEPPAIQVPTHLSEPQLSLDASLE